MKGMNNMKLSVKLLSLLLALMMLLASAMLTSCEKNPPDVTPSGTEDTTEVTTPAETTTSIPESADLKLVENGVANCTVIRSEDADPSSVAVSCASDLRLAIQSATGIKTAPKIDTDWIKAGQKHDSEALEILVGVTNYDESAEVFKDVTYGSYIIKVVGNKLVVAAYTDSAINSACTKLKTLLNSCVDGDNLTIPADTFITNVVDTKLDTLPAYDGGLLNCIYECGGNAKMIYIKNTNADEYNAYTEKLSGAGYTAYTTNEITGNLFGTYTNDSYTLNVGFYEYEKATRIIFEPFISPIGLESDNKYTKITTSQITMLGLEYLASDGGYASNGLSMLIRLEDGRFIVIDGGFNRDFDATFLIKLMKEQSADYLKSGEKPVIAGWIITHAHGDHSGMIGKRYGTIAANAKVEKFYVNFISDTERNKAINSSSYSSNWGQGEGGGWTNVITAARALGATVQYVHVGQVIYLADLKMEILFTIESYAPKLCNAFNTTSLIIKMTFGTGDTFMMTGDATGNAFQIAAKMFKNYLKSDILQVSHHGYTTWGNDQGTKDGYKYIAPAVLLWPQGTSAYPKYQTKGYNVVLFSPEYINGGANENFKEIYVAGKEGEYITLTFPYTIGSATEVRVSAN